MIVLGLARNVQARKAAVTGYVRRVLAICGTFLSARMQLSISFSLSNCTR